MKKSHRNMHPGSTGYIRKTVVIMGKWPKHGEKRPGHELCLRSEEGNDRLAAEGPGLSGSIAKKDGSFGSCLVRGRTSGKASTPRPQEKAELENGSPCQYPCLLVLPWKSVQLHRQRTLSETRIEPWGSRRVAGVVGMGFPSFLKLLPALVAGHVGLSWIFWIYYPGYFG